MAPYNGIIENRRRIRRRAIGKTVMINMRHGIVALALVVGGLPTAAFAEFKPSATLRSACMSDAMRLCSAYLSSMDRVLTCLQEKKSQASPKCQAQYDAETKTAAKK
jgi:hypothetical protein